MYGGGAKALYEALLKDHNSPINLGDKEYLSQYKCRNGKEVAQKYIDKYFASYKGVADFIKNQRRLAHQQGFVQTVLGRKRRLPMLFYGDKEQVSYGERLAVNSAIQGSAADITMSAQNLIDADERLKELGVKMLIQIHDEIVCECPEENCEEACEIIKYHMEHMFGKLTAKLNLPITCEYDTGWSYAEAK